MNQGIITFDSNKGWYFAKNLADHTAIFVHQNQIENQRYLKVGDRISFDVAPSTSNPGKTMAVNVKYLGHTIAAQFAGKVVL